MKKNSKNLKEDHINVRCTSEQKNLIEKAAAKEGMGASTWLLRLGLVTAQPAAEARR